jgi:GDP-mannose transporter
MPGDAEEECELQPTKLGHHGHDEEASPSFKTPAASPPAESEASRYTIGVGIVLYAFCSSTLLVVNKVAMHVGINPSLLLFAQFLTSTLSVRGLKAARPDMDIEFLVWEKARPFALAALVFYICLLSNTQALAFVNVETVIVVRACSPIAVALLDHMVLGKELPSAKGALALLTIAGGAALYVVTDKGFRVDGYTWLGIYFVSIVIEMVFVKFVVDTIKMSTWTRVYYNNTISLPMAVFSGVVERGSGFVQTSWNFQQLSALGVACIVGFAISYAGFNLRKLISATSFTVVGVVCKIFTVLINDVIWTQHSNAFGHVGLLICICSGFLYERAKSAQAAAKTAANSGKI